MKRATIVLAAVVSLTATQYAKGASTWNVPVNYTTIQDAIDNVLTLNGDTITVDPGTYNERLNVTKSLTFQGAQLGVDPTPFGARTNPAFESIITEIGLSTPNPDVLIEIPDSVDNVTFNGFTLNGDLTNTVADTSVLRIGNTTGSDNVQVMNNYINGRVGVLFKGGTGLVVDQNVIESNKAGIIGQPGTVTNVTISDNDIKIGSTPETDPSGINMSGPTNSTITGNSISGFHNTTFNNGRGIGGSSWNTALIQDNVIDGNKDGISIFSSTTDIDILDNTFSNNTRHGVNIKGANVDINGNLIINNGTHGVNIDFHVNNSTNNTVNQNSFSGNGSNAVWVNGATSLTQIPIVDASGNWWGDASGPSGGDQDAVTFLFASGTGDGVSDNGAAGGLRVTWDPVLASDPFAAAAEASVPEPSSFLLWALGLVGLHCRALRRRRR